MQKVIGFTKSIYSGLMEFTAIIIEIKFKTTHLVAINKYKHPNINIIMGIRKFTKQTVRWPNIEYTKLKIMHKQIQTNNSI